MRWFGSLGRFFKRVDEYAASYIGIPYVLQFVTVSLGIPCLKTSDFFFQVVYFCQQRQILLRAR